MISPVRNNVSLSLSKNENATCRRSQCGVRAKHNVDRRRDVIRDNLLFRGAATAAEWKLDRRVYVRDA